MGAVVGVGRKVAFRERAVLSDDNGKDCCCGGDVQPILLCGNCSCFDTYAFSWQNLTLRSFSALAPTKKITHRWRFEGTVSATTSCTAIAGPPDFSLWEYEIIAYDDDAGGAFNCPVGTVCTNDTGLQPQLELVCVDQVTGPPARRRLSLIVARSFGTLCACSNNIFFFSGGQFGIFNVSNTAAGQVPPNVAYCPDQQFVDPPWVTLMNGGPPGNFAVEILDPGTVSIT